MIAFLLGKRCFEMMRVVMQAMMEVNRINISKHLDKPCNRHREERYFCLTLARSLLDVVAESRSVECGCK
jgi:hypothetical protein